MNVTYLVGNGFDLALKMHTSAKEIVASYVSMHLPGDNKEELLAGEKLALEIEDKGIETWSDFETKLGEYSLKFRDSKYGTKQDYLDAYEEFSKHLHAELVKEYDRFSSNNVIEKNPNCILSIVCIATSLREGESEIIHELLVKHRLEHCVYNIATFNYTRTIDDFFNGASDTLGKMEGSGYSHILGKLFHAHGDLEDVIICGVDSPEQILNDEFQQDEAIIQALVKHNAQRYLASNSDTRVFEAIRQSKVICIYGMSLGKSDKRWWKAIIDHLNNDKEAVLVIFSYERTKQIEHTTSEYQRNKEYELSLFADAAGELGSDLFNSIRDRVFFAASSSVFSLEHTLDE